MKYGSLLFGGFVRVHGPQRYYLLSHLQHYVGILKSSSDICGIDGSSAVLGNGTPEGGLMSTA